VIFLSMTVSQNETHALECSRVRIQCEDGSRTASSDDLCGTWVSVQIKRPIGIDQMPEVYRDAVPERYCSAARRFATLLMNNKLGARAHHHVTGSWNYIDEVQFNAQLLQRIPALEFPYNEWTRTIEDEWSLKE